MTNTTKNPTGVSIFGVLLLVTLNMLIVYIFINQSSAAETPPPVEKICDIKTSVRTYKSVPEKDIIPAPKGASAKFKYRGREVVALDGYIECRKKPS